MAASTDTLQTFDLTTEEGTRAYLATTEWADAEIISLSGGVTNFLYRLQLPAPYKGHQSLILKHGLPHPRGYKALEFTLDRQMYEVEALRHIHQWLPADAFVTVPDVFLFDPSAHVIVMEDAGLESTNLKDFLQTGRASESQAQKIGAEVGAFLGRMHKWGTDNEELLDIVRGFAQARELSAWVFYGRLVSTVTGENRPPKLEDPPLEVNANDVEVLTRVAELTTKALTAESHNTFIMGDFWPGNLVVKTDSNGNLERIYVLDWELAKTGPVGMDIGQFASEINLLRRCNPETCKDTASALLEHFFTEYKANYALSLTEVRGAIVHWGAHATVWGARVDWGGKEITQEVVKEGVRLVVTGWSGDEALLRDSPIGALV